MSIDTINLKHAFEKIVDLELSLGNPVWKPISEDTPKFWNDNRAQLEPLLRTGSWYAIIQYVGFLKAAFCEPYKGMAAQALYEALTDDNRGFDGSSKHYGKFKAYIQGSGSGKSRTIMELTTKGVFVIYINLRSPMDVDNWPPRDDIIADILLGPVQTADEYEKLCCVFFAALFTTLEEFITAHALEDALSVWNELIGDELKWKKWFMDVQTQYRLKATVDQSLSDAKNKMILSLDTLVKKCPTYFRKTHVPKLAIVFDEAHYLNPDKDSKFSRPHLLCRTISTYSHQSTDSIWVLFVSTSSRISDFAAPAFLYPSQRVSLSGACLCPPFITTGSDHFAPPLATSVDYDFAAWHNVIKFGRPLWLSLRHLGLKGLVALGRNKLTNSPNASSDYSNDTYLCVLAQHFGLDLCIGHPDAGVHVENAIAGHMRTCTGVTPDRWWMFSTYPSEPFLSHVAATVLYGEAFLSDALQVLTRKLASGMLDIGQVGELTSRMLLLLARDAVLNQLIPPRPSPPSSPPNKVQPRGSEGGIHDPDEPLNYCKEIQLLEWFEMLFGAQFFPEHDKVKVEDVFKDAYVNLSHWVGLKENICEATREHWNLSQWLLRHYQRGCAIQCTHNQPQIDKIGPIMFKDDAKRPIEQCMSAWVVSDKARKSSNKNSLNLIQLDAVLALRLKP
ncbi:hypothetical protein QCA50_019596 [Cerrena zonata]|uniref:Uncharacterized protein n=1 Tax=Cerrena zonata TaxID=2478898 RepID=A0AAW0F993_9APHY